MERAALITGAGQGIGKACVLAFLEAGYAVAGVDCDKEALKELEQELGEGEYFLLEADVSLEISAKMAVQRCSERFGRLDVLINNAGVMHHAPVEELDLDDWNRVLAVNLTGPFLFVKHAARLLRPSHGSVVNIASTRAYQSEPGTEAYSASKGGLTALTHALAVSLGPDIRVNAIAPGWIDVSGWKRSSKRRQEELTDLDHAQHPAGRVGRPEDVASLALYLASEQTGFLTGQTIVLDGGMTKKMIYAE